tara:strand:- start:3187 stop:3783 length:597 start_codon:yes stop_codon:yes gene_type:complete
MDLKEETQSIIELAFSQFDEIPVFVASSLLPQVVIPVMEDFQTDLSMHTKTVTIQHKHVEIANILVETIEETQTPTEYLEVVKRKLSLLVAEERRKKIASQAAEYNLRVPRGMAMPTRPMSTKKMETLLTNRNTTFEQTPQSFSEQADRFVLDKPMDSLKSVYPGYENLNYNKFAKLSETNTQKINALTNAIGEKYFA